MKTQNLTVIGLFITILLTGAKEVGAAPMPPVLLHSLFNPNTSAQPGALQGYSVAMDGNFVVVGIPGAPAPDTAQAENTGVVKAYDATNGALRHTLKNPRPPPPNRQSWNAGSSDSFGYSVAISGTLVVVGVPYDNVPTTIDPNTAYMDTGSVYIYDLRSSNPTAPVATLNNPDPQAGDLFGYSVAISGGQMVVGAPADNGSGSIYMYDLSALLPTVVPVLLASVSNPNPSLNDRFGHSVAISGAAVAVGAPFGHLGGTDGGTVYLYDIGNRFTRGVPVVTLTNPNPAGNDGFGSSVAIASTRLLVGAPFDDTVALDAGSAYVYDYSLDTVRPTVLVGTLTPPNPVPSGLFAYSVAASEQSLAVGNHTAESTYIYDFASATPAVPVATLSNPGPGTDDRFGYSVAVSSTRLLVGAPYDDSLAVDAGSAYLYDLASATPTVPSATMNDQILAAGGGAGRSVAASGTRVVVGADGNASAYIYDLSSATSTIPVTTLTGGAGFGEAVGISGALVAVGAPYEGPGIAYVFDLAGGTPTVPLMILTNPAAGGGDWFGYSVSISGAKVAVGAPFAGSTYVYDINGATPSVPVATLNDPNGDRFGWSVSISGTRVVVGAPYDSTVAGQAGVALVYDLTSATPTVPVVTLNNPANDPSQPINPAAGDFFGEAVAISGTRVVVGAPYGQEPSHTGIAYVFDLASATPATPVATLNKPGPATSPEDYFGDAVAISGTVVVVGATYQSIEARSTGGAYVFDLASATPRVPVALNNPSPGAYDYFGSAVAVDGNNIVVGAPGDDTNAQDRGAAYVFGPSPMLNVRPPAPAF